MSSTKVEKGISFFKFESLIRTVQGQRDIYRRYTIFSESILKLPNLENGVHLELVAAHFVGFEEVCLY